MARKLKYNFLTLPSLEGHADYQSTPGTPDLPIVRATAAWDTDADGYIRQYQSGEARVTGATFNHNLVLQSQDTTTSWANANTTDSANATTDPLGGSTADELVGVGTGGDRNLYQNGAPFNVGRHGRYLFSGYFKASVIDWMSLRFGDADERSYFDLTNGVVGTKNAAHAASSISDEGNGWYRCTIVTDLTGETAIPVIYLASADLTNSGTNGDSIYVWGLQVEYDPTGARTTPGTYIATTTASVTSLSGTSTLGLKIEEARTNIGTYSEDVTNWSISGVTRSANQAVSPDGATTADELIEDGAASRHEAFSGYAVSASDYTFSVFAKANTRTNIQLWSSGDATTFATFNLSTGAVTASAGGASGIEDTGNGWYRCWAVFTMASATTYNFYTTLQDSPTATRAASYTGDGSSSLYVWGRQIELGKFPLSYIPTTTASVTRNADAVSTSDLSWHDSEKGSVYTRFSSSTGDRDITAVPIYSVDLNAVGSDYWRHTINQFSTRTGEPTSQLRESNGTTDSSAGGANDTPMDGSTYRFASGWESGGSLLLAVDGTSYTADSSLITASLANCNRLALGNAAGVYLNGHIAEITYWDERFSDSILEEVSLGNFSNTEDQVFKRKKARDRFRRRYRRT